MLQSNDCSRGKSVALISLFRNKDDIEIHTGVLQDKGKAGEGHKAWKFLHSLDNETRNTFFVLMKNHLLGISCPHSITCSIHT